MIRIPVADAPYQTLQIELDGRLVDIVLRYSNLNDAWTFDLIENEVELVRGQRVVLQTDLLRGHALKIGALLAIASYDTGTDPAAGDFAERVSLFHLTEAEVAALVAA